MYILPFSAADPVLTRICASDFQSPGNGTVVFSEPDHACERSPKPGLVLPLPLPLSTAKPQADQQHQQKQPSQEQQHRQKRHKHQEQELQQQQQQHGGAAVHQPSTAASTPGKNNVRIDQPPAAAAPAPDADLDGASQSQPTNRPRVKAPAVDPPESVFEPMSDSTSEPVKMKEFPEGSGNLVVDDETHKRMYPGGAVLGVEMLLEVWIMPFVLSCPRFSSRLLFSRSAVV